jgi:LPXTG-site transpeptidase (sortase) family protein
MQFDARPRHGNVRGRALLVVACLAMAAAGVFGWLAVFGGKGSPDAVVLDVETAVASTTPDTLPLLVPAAPAVVPATPTTLPLSPLAEQLGRQGSAIPVEPPPLNPPMSLTIGDIELWGPVRAVGLDLSGEMEVPDETEIGWYELGSAPGQAGATVLAAHVTWNQTVGPFFRLGDLEPGDRIDVELSDRSVRIYEVVERTMYRKTELPRERIWRTTGPETLVLITCGGDFNDDINRYRDNIVVYAVPIATTPAPSAST